MDINRVELKGTIAYDLVYRKTAKDSEWVTFTLVTNEYTKSAAIEKDKSTPTWTNVSVFNNTLINRLKKSNAHQGSKIWLVGKLYTQKVEKYGHMQPYTSVVANELAILMTKDKLKDTPKIINTTEESDF